MPDIGILSLDRFKQCVREVALGSGLPVIADADTGFGEEEMVRRTVIEYNHAGAAAAISKTRSSQTLRTPAGKALIPMAQAVARMHWAAGVAGLLGWVVHRLRPARMPTVWEPRSKRTRTRRAGALMIFPRGARIRGRVCTLCRRTGQAVRQAAYLLANMTEFGKAPIIPLTRFGEMGYHVVIFPVSTLPHRDGCGDGRWRTSNPPAVSQTRSTGCRTAGSLRHAGL